MATTLKVDVQGWAGTAGHVAVTLVAALLCPLLGLACAGSFLGREIAQAEYRYIKAHGGKRADCPWHCGFMPSAWTFKALMDWLLPMIVAVAIYAI